MKSFPENPRWASVLFIVVAFAVSGLNPIQGLAIASVPVATPLARSNDGAPTLESGEPDIRKPTTLTIAGSADAIAELTAATTGRHIPLLTCTMPLTCDSGGAGDAWPPQA